MNLQSMLITNNNVQQYRPEFKGSLPYDIQISEKQPDTEHLSKRVSYTIRYLQMLGESNFNLDQKKEIFNNLRENAKILTIVLLPKDSAEIKPLDAEEDESKDDQPPLAKAEVRVSTIYPPEKKSTVEITSKLAYEQFLMQIQSQLLQKKVKEEKARAYAYA